MRMEPSTKGRRACCAIANGRNKERLAVVSVEPIQFWVDDAVGGVDRAPVGSSPRDLLRAKFSFCGARADFSRRLPCWPDPADGRDLLIWTENESHSFQSSDSIATVLSGSTAAATFGLI